MAPDTIDIDKPSQEPTEAASIEPDADNDAEETGSPEPIEWPPSPVYDTSTAEVAAS